MLDTNLRVLAAVALIIACHQGSPAADVRSPTLSGIDSVTAAQTEGGSTTDVTDADEGLATSGTEAADSDGDDDSGGDEQDPCAFCIGIDEVCADGACVPSCRGDSPDPCGPAQVCDVISGQCHDPGAACTLAGEYAPCGEERCGPGTVCDGLGHCVAIAPCNDVACAEDGSCWGSECACERSDACEPAAVDAFNGPFSDRISDLAFADDCTAWMVTLSGWDFVRRLSPDGEMSEWAGVSNLNMGEVEVLKALAPPAGVVPPDTGTIVAALSGSRPQAIEGPGEVAVSYICCASCNCASTPRQGLARFVEEDVDVPFPMVIEADPTTGAGPFGSFWSDTGPFGLAWGRDRTLYIGNSTSNGVLHAADLDAGTASEIFGFESRIHATISITEAHLLVALVGGEILRFNVRTLTAEPVVQLATDVTSLAFDPLTGSVFASLRDFDVIELDAFSGVSSVFATMPGRGRVAISPDGRLWYVPMAFLFDVAGQPVPPIMTWPLPPTF